MVTGSSSLGVVGATTWTVEETVEATSLEF
jgi:hypothetical protein